MKIGDRVIYKNMTFGYFMTGRIISIYKDNVEIIFDFSSREGIDITPFLLDMDKSLITLATDENLFSAKLECY